MPEPERIADQASKMFGGGAWHGPAVLELLADVTAGDAASRPIRPDRHAKSIERAFEMDRLAIAKFRRGVKADRLAATREYVRGLRRVDHRSCPPDFQEAFLKHR